MRSIAIEAAAIARSAGVRADGARKSGSPLGDAIRRHGVPVPVGAIYAANTVTPSELERIREEARIREMIRARDAARRAREDAMADEWAANVR